MAENYGLLTLSGQDAIFPRTYYVSLSTKLLYFAFFLFSCIVTIGQVGRPGGWVSYFLNAFTAFIWLNAVMLRVVLYNDRIERITWGISKVLMKEDITGYCKFRGYKSAALVFETKDSISLGIEIGNLRVPTTLKRDYVWDDWVRPLAVKPLSSS